MQGIKSNINPLLSIEIRRQRFPSLLLSVALLLIVMAVSSGTAFLLNDSRVVPIYTHGLLVIYLLWLALPLFSTVVVAGWMNTDLKRDTFQMLRQSGLNDHQISRGYVLRSLYRLRVPLALINGLLPVLLLQPVSAQAGVLSFLPFDLVLIGGWLLLLPIGLAWFLLAISIGVMLVLQRGTFGAVLIWVGSAGLGLLSVARLYYMALLMPLWMVTPAIDVGALYSKVFFLLPFPLIAALILLHLPWRQQRIRWSQISGLMISSGLLAIGVLTMVRNPTPWLNVYAQERQVLRELFRISLGPQFLNHCNITSVRCNDAGRIEFLDLRYSYLTEIPSSIGQLTHLQELNLSYNRLTELPPEIGQLRSLRQLNLRFNSLSDIPPTIGQLSHLEELDLSYNALMYLPPRIGNLTNLRVLHVSYNVLTELPPEISHLILLEELALDGNQLTELPPEMGQLARLEYLNLGGNDLRTLPPEIGQLTQLKILHLSFNGLSALPPQIDRLADLEVLHLGGNMLDEFPTEIGNLTELQRLYLYSNSLSDVPPHISHLTNLQELHLSDNNLDSLNPDFGDLTALQRLELDGNPLTELPIELCPLLPQLVIISSDSLQTDIERRCEADYFNRFMP